VSNPTLAARQAALVAALVAGAAVPDGFDAGRVDAAERALRRKRAGEVARVWPRLAAGLGTERDGRFSRWARARPSHGGLRDGWDLARELSLLGQLPRIVEVELALREVGARYGGRTAPAARGGLAARRVRGGWVVGALGRVHLVWWS
jgi:hypothetical protein